MRYKCSGLDQAAINAELRERFGETCTRAEIMQYREDTGNDPRWIRKGQACNIGRGLYRIPGGTDSDSAPAPMPKLAKREKVVKDDEPIGDDRSVISTPFDDGHYDEDAPVAEKSKRGRKPKEEAVTFGTGRTLDEAGEVPKPEYVHAWICDARIEKRCPGRKPSTAYGPDDAAPMCECGSTMTRHAWAPSKKLF